MNPSMGPVLVNNNNLEGLVSGLQIVSINAHHPPKQTLSQYIIANANRSKTTQNYFTSKKISITCVIKRQSRVLLEKSLDTLWPIIAGNENTLIITQSDQQRRYTATWADTIWQEERGGYAKFDIVFSLSDQFGYDTNYTLLIDQSNITAVSSVFTMADLDGSAEFQAPLITLWLSVATYSGNEIGLVVGNANNGQEVSILRDHWSVDDFVQIDSVNKSVTINGVPTTYSGMIPEWQPKSIVGTGNAKISIGDDLATRKWRMRVTYNKRWV